MSILSHDSHLLPPVYFRHEGEICGVKAGQPYGEKHFYKWWVKACENLGIEGVDMYGGTRHGSAVAFVNILALNR